MTVKFIGEHLGLTNGGIYEVIPYPKKLKKAEKHFYRLKNDFGYIFDYPKKAFEVVNPLNNDKHLPLKF